MTRHRRAARLILLLVAGTLPGAQPARAQIPVPPPQCTAASGELPACSTGTPAVNKCWEHSFQSSQAYNPPSGNAYRNLSVKVTYRLAWNAQATYSSLAFWHARASGKEVYRFRTAFPTWGNWTWTTQCTDAATGQPCPVNLGLTGKTGTVTVPPPPGELNPLYAKGFLKQSASTAGGVTDVRWITYGDGGDFFWLGDAAWAATMQATPEE